MAASAMLTLIAVCRGRGNDMKNGESDSLWAGL